MVLSSCLFVAANYVAGAALADRFHGKMGHLGYRLYCIAGALLWVMYGAVKGFTQAARLVRVAVRSPE
eukprot:gene3314-16915_t